MKFSVSMSVYKNDNPCHFEIAVQSVLNQTVPPSEVVIVVDGPIPESIEIILANIVRTCTILKVVRLEENKGHAIARQTGLENTTNDFVALMDSDDISCPDRFEKQLDVFYTHPEVSIVGGQISEFIGDVDNIVAERHVPMSDNDIKKYLKSRCPFNQMTVMFKKDDILSVGGYMHWYCNEDYYLWVRMFKAGFSFVNIPDILVNVRVGNEMYQRRGGMPYFLSEAKLQKYMCSNGTIGFFRFIYNVMIRFVIQVLLPNNVRAYIFKKNLRKSIK